MSADTKKLYFSIYNENGVLLYCFEDILFAIQNFLKKSFTLFHVISMTNYQKC